MQKKTNGFSLGGIIGETLKWRLHPLIHTLLGFNVTQDFVDAQDRDSKR